MKLKKGWTFPYFSCRRCEIFFHAFLWLFFAHQEMKGWNPNHHDIELTYLKVSCIKLFKSSFIPQLVNSRILFHLQARSHALCLCLFLIYSVVYSNNFFGFLLSFSCTMIFGRRYLSVYPLHFCMVFRKSQMSNMKSQMSTDVYDECFTMSFLSCSQFHCVFLTSWNRDKCHWLHSKVGYIFSTCIQITSVWKR